MQEHTESTHDSTGHEDEEIQTLKDTCCTAFEEECSPDCKPISQWPFKLLSKLLEKQPFRIGHLLPMLHTVAVHAKLAKVALNAKIALNAISKQHQMLTP